jgi:hypothetical protein
VVESAPFLLLDKVLEVTNVSVLCDLDLKYIDRASSDHPTIELEIGSWKAVSTVSTPSDALLPDTLMLFVGDQGK